MTTSRKRQNVGSYDAAARVVAGMNQDVANLKKLLLAPSLDAVFQMDKALDQLRLDQNRIIQALLPRSLPPPLGPVGPLKDIFAASNHIYDVLGKSSVSMVLGEMAHESWRKQIESLTEISAPLDAAAKLNLCDTTLQLAATQNFLAGIDFNSLKVTFDIPVSIFSDIEQSLSDITASYRSLLQSIPDLSAIVKWPSFVLPGATVTLLLAAYALRVLDLLIQPDNEESEGDDLSSIVEYLENLDFTALLEQVNPSLAPVYLGARNDLEGDAPDRARHVLYSLRELSNLLIREIAPLEQNLEWLSNHGEKGDWDNNCRPSRRGKIRFLTRKINSRTLVDFVDTCTRLSSKLHKFYNRLHKLDPGLSDNQLNAIHYGTVAQLSFLIQVWQTTTQHQGPH